jgi:hypothetical protein
MTYERITTVSHATGSNMARIGRQAGSGSSRIAQAGDMPID